MSGPDFRHQRRRAARRHKPIQRRPAARCNLWLAPITAVAFVAALSTFNRFPAEVDALAAPVGALFASEDRAAPNFAMRDRLSVHFTFCHSGGGSNCVVDGDTFWFAGEKYRIADIDTPETHPARCHEEAALGGAATERLRQWLNDGTFSLENAGRDSDGYGRKLRIVTRGGDSVGSLLVGEGLARPWEGRRRPWCASAS